MAREDLHFRLRIPEDLKKKIEQSAGVHRRSMTAEIISRLEASFRDSVPLPKDLSIRIESYAAEHGRTLGEEVVRVLERVFPAPRTPDEKFGEVLGILAGLQAGADADTAFSKFSAEVLRTLRSIANGETKVDPATRLRVEEALENWDRAMAERIMEEATANMDPEEYEKFIRTGDDSIIVDPVFKEDEE